MDHLGKLSPLSSLGGCRKCACKYVVPSLALTKQSQIAPQEVCAQSGPNSRSTSIIVTTGHTSEASSLANKTQITPSLILSSLLLLLVCPLIVTAGSGSLLLRVLLDSSYLDRTSGLGSGGLGRG